MKDIKKTAQDNQTLIDFWNQTFFLSESQKEQLLHQEAEDWKNLASSVKLFKAVTFLAKQNKVLDYGCGSGWASIILAKSGCPDVAAVDVSSNAVEATTLFLKQYHVEDNVNALWVSSNWLQSVPKETFDGLFCSNVLDVIPPETAEAIIKEFARIVTDDALVIVSLNYYLSQEEATKRSMKLVDGNLLYICDVLRLVSRSDEEWKHIFSPYFEVEHLEYFAWPGEKQETRRIFWLRKLN